MGKKKKKTHVRKQPSRTTEQHNDDKLPSSNNSQGKNKYYKKGKNNSKNNNTYHHSSHNDNDDDVKLRAAIEQDGTKSVIEMAADGNCLFRSLGDQLYYDYGSCHDEIRSQVCDLLEAFPDDYAAFLLPDDDGIDPNSEKDVQDVESYVAEMRQDGTWGGNVELVVAARLYKRNITVFSTNYHGNDGDLAAFTINHHASAASSSSSTTNASSDNKQQQQRASTGPDLWLSYHENGHYNSVRNVNNHKGKPPPPVLTTFVKANNNNNDGVSKKKKRGEHGAQPMTEKNGNAEGNDGDEILSVVDLVKEETEEEEQQQQQQPHHDVTKAVDETIDGAAAAAATVTSLSKKVRPPIKKNAPCSCGSGLKYKKCCFAKEKHIKRLQKLQQQPESETKVDTTKGGEDDVEATTAATNEMDGAFRVLKI